MTQKEKDGLFNLVKQQIKYQKQLIIEQERNNILQERTHIILEEIYRFMVRDIV